jgi:hypothetical protein
MKEPLQPLPDEPSSHEARSGPPESQQTRAAMALTNGGKA